jgi:hypothetical protein
MGQDTVNIVMPRAEFMLSKSKLHDGDRDVAFNLELKAIGSLLPMIPKYLVFSLHIYPSEKQDGKVMINRLRCLSSR